MIAVFYSYSFHFLVCLAFQNWDERSYRTTRGHSFDVLHDKILVLIQVLQLGGEKFHTSLSNKANLFFPMGKSIALLVSFGRMTEYKFCFWCLIMLGKFIYVHIIQFNAASRHSWLRGNKEIEQKALGLPNEMLVYAMPVRWLQRGLWCLLRKGVAGYISP